VCGGGRRWVSYIVLCQDQRNGCNTYTHIWHTRWRCLSPGIFHTLLVCNSLILADLFSEKAHVLSPISLSPAARKQQSTILPSPLSCLCYFNSTAPLKYRTHKVCGVFAPSFTGHIIDILPVLHRDGQRGQCGLYLKSRSS
jgi:hypothetical protein